MDVRMRQAGPEDLAFMREMLYQSIFTPPGRPALGREILEDPQIARYLTGWGRPGDAGLIALADGVRAGAAWYRCMPRDDPGFGFVAKDIPELGIALEPWARGQGIGSRLLQQLVDHARQAGLRGISLSVDPQNPALRLYERLGWRRAGTAGTSLTLLRDL